jgi:hypothetical protein
MLLVKNEAILLVNHKPHDLLFSASRPARILAFLILVPWAGLYAYDGENEWS